MKGAVIIRTIITIVDKKVENPRESSPTRRQFPRRSSGNLGNSKRAENSTPANYATIASRRVKFINSRAGNNAKLVSNQRRNGGQRGYAYYAILGPSLLRRRCRGSARELLSTRIKRTIREIAPV